MDSKLRNLAIVVMILLVVTVTGLVWLLNFDFNKTPQVNEPQETTANEASAGDGEAVTDEFAALQIGDDLGAFMRDEAFFDRDSFDLDLDKYQRELSLLVSSVDRDLRVYVLDLLGRVVRGESFYISVDGVGEFKDLDMDGSIYIADLSPGEYYVSLMPIEGYSTPKTRVKVAVKDQITYTLIDDISYLIHTEDEIDAATEDTEQAQVDADATENKNPLSGDATRSFGIDVSKWNKEIDWEKAKDFGVKFAIIRVGYRGSKTGALVVDPYFEQNIRGAVNAGISVGVYFFTQAVNEREAVEEASMAMALCRGYRLDFPIFIDSEGAGGNGRADYLDKEQRTLIAQAFTETVKSSGEYTAGLYASKSWLENNIDPARLKNSIIWLAQYRSAPTYGGSYQMWQYSSKGSIDGIAGNVDLNIAFTE